MLGGQGPSQDYLDVRHLRGTSMHPSPVGGGRTGDHSSREVAQLPELDRGTQIMSRGIEEWEGFEEAIQGGDGGRGIHRCGGRR